MNDDQQPARLLMNRSEFSDMTIDTLDAAPGAGEGQVTFRLDRFALTFNNVTYATYGDVLGYWRFFPVEREGWGQLPVWGYADVAGSRVDGIEPGQRYYGYWPTATHFTALPDSITRHGFRDAAAHRAELPDIYNRYQRTDNDPFHDAASEPLHAVYRPLFITAFCLADFLDDSNAFDADRIVVSSASSKTAYATAFCLRRHSAIERIGLTSPGNRAFVESLGLYDSVLTYDELDRLDADTPTLYVDVAGNPKLQRRIHDHLGTSLVYDCSVGSAQSLVPPEPDRAVSGPKPQFFFAPEWIAKRYADWGAGEFNQRAGRATIAFYQYVRQQGLLEIVESSGLDAAQRVLTELLDGHTNPRQGHVITP